MKLFTVIAWISALACVAVSEKDVCSARVGVVCSPGTLDSNLNECGAKYSTFEHIKSEIDRFINLHLTQSFEYLLMSLNYEHYKYNRQGFAKFFRKMSDNAWEEAIDLVKYVTKRGGAVNFQHFETELVVSEVKNLTMHELASLARALDMQKAIAHKAHQIHRLTTKNSEDYHEAEVMSYIEENYVHQHAEKVRELAGYTNELKNLIFDDKYNGLSMFLFDEYLQSVV